jgi:hypothetical protein
LASHSMWRLSLLGGIALLATSTMVAAGEKPAAPTYHKDVVRILQKNCQDCHRPSQVAPFSLLTYEQARKRASDLVHVTGERTMPPWPASSSFGGPFRDARVLTSDEIATLQSWADADCPEGDPKDWQGHALQSLSPLTGKTGKEARLARTGKDMQSLSPPNGESKLSRLMQPQKKLVVSS